MSEGTPQPSARQLRRNPDLTNRIGRNIARARATSGLTQMQLAGRLDEWTDPVTVSRWERGRHRPHERTLVRLAVILDVELDWFYEDHDEPEEAAA